MTKLLAARFENNDTSAELIEQFDNVQGIGIRWATADYGTDRIEVTILIKNEIEYWALMNDWPGQRLAVYSDWGSRPISGNITEIQLAGPNTVKLIARGPAWRFKDTNVRDTFPSGQDTDQRIKNLLTSHVPIVSSNHDNIDATGQDAFRYQTPWPLGAYPYQIIEAYLKMSDPSNNVWDFYCTDETFDGLNLRQYLPFLKNRNARTTPDWVVYKRDMSGGVKLSRSIADYMSEAVIYYGGFDGTVTTANAAGTTLIDSSANFTGFEVEPGDRVVNVTDGSRGKVQSVTSGSELVLVGDGLLGGTDDRFDLNDEYIIIRQDAWYRQTQTVTNPIIDRHYYEDVKEFDATQAAAYAGEIVGFYGKPVQQQSFVLTAQTIQDGNGARWPLWEVIAQGGGLIQIADLYPAAASFSGGFDSLTTFFITALDYDYTRNALTVRIDTRDGRLDSRLAAQNIIGGSMVARGG